MVGSLLAYNDFTVGLWFQCAAVVVDHNFKGFMAMFAANLFTRRRFELVVNAVFFLAMRTLNIFQILPRWHDLALSHGERLVGHQGSIKMHAM